MIVQEDFPSADPLVAGSSSELRVIVSNLIRNAIDAGHEGDKVTVRVRVSGSEAEIVVADTCEGIPTEISDHIFDFNFSTKSDGTGLGLVLAKKEAERLGGRIEFASALGVGTELRVTLPIVT